MPLFAYQLVVLYRNRAVLCSRLGIGGGPENPVSVSSSCVAQSNDDRAIAVSQRKYWMTFRSRCRTQGCGVSIDFVPLRLLMRATLVVSELGIPILIFTRPFGKS